MTLERAFFPTASLPSSLDLPDTGLLDTTTEAAREAAHRVLASARGISCRRTRPPRGHGLRMGRL